MGVKMRKENSKIQTSFLSEAGSFLKNGDYFAFVELEDYACYCIADGIDEDKKKESARIAVTAVIEQFQENPKFSKRQIIKYIHTAHLALQMETGDIRLEASIVIMVTDYRKMMWANAGNSRIYHLRNNVIRNQSLDHSLSQNLAEIGNIPKDKVEEHEERHNLYCYLGQPDKFKPSVSKKIKLADADTALLCTRGVWENVGAAELLDSMEEVKSPKEVCSALEEVLLSQQRPHLQNYTTACIFFDKIYKNPEKKKKILKTIIAVAIPLLVIALTIGIILYSMDKSRKKQLKQMQEYRNSGMEYIAEQNYERASEDLGKGIEIAKKISMKTSSVEYFQKEEMGDYKKLSGQMVDAAAAVEKKDYKKAIAYYDLALKEQKNILSSVEEDRIYIEQQKKLAMDYMDVLQNIKIGDKKGAVEDYEGAEAAYKKALDISTNIYYVDGKQEASEKLTDIQTKQFQIKKDSSVKKGDEYAEKAEKAMEDEDTASAEKYYKKAKAFYDKGESSDKASEMQGKMDGIKEQEKAEEKQELVTEAEQTVKDGDRLAEKGDFIEAMDSYYLAIDLYSQAKQPDSVATVQTKIELTDKKNNETRKQQSQADDYQKKAEEKLKLSDYDSAIVLYNLAKDIYRELDMKSEMNGMKKKVNEIQKQIKEEEKETELKEQAESKEQTE